MRKILIGILSVCIIGTATAALLYRSNSKAISEASEFTRETACTVVDKTFKGFIYTGEGKLVKSVPIKISGKHYNKTAAARDYFTGQIEIAGEVIDISSSKDKEAAFSGLDLNEFYHASNPFPNAGVADNEKCEIELTTSIIISKDFKAFYGYTPGLKSSFGAGAFFKSDQDIKTLQEEHIEYRKEAAKRVDLYIAALKAAFQKGNGGNGFIALKEETLEGLKDEKSRLDGLESLKSLSHNVFWYESVNADKSLFEIDKHGNRIRTYNGTVLSIRVKEFKENDAVIEVTSWYGNLGAVMPGFKAIDKNGKWQLRLLGITQS